MGYIEALEAYVRNIRIEELNLSNATYCLLKRNNIKTDADIYMLDRKKELKTIRGLGAGKLEEINKALIEYNRVGLVNIPNENAEGSRLYKKGYEKALNDLVGKLEEIDPCEFASYTLALVKEKAKELDYGK